MQLTRAHWSYSQLAQYLRCPLQYFFERIARLPKPFAPSGLVLGRAVHEALAGYHRSVQQQQTCHVVDVQRFFLLAWESAESERPIQYRSGESQGSIVEQGLALLSCYLRQPPPEQIIAVEQCWLVHLVYEPRRDPRQATGRLNRPAHPRETGAGCQGIQDQQSSIHRGGRRTGSAGHQLFSRDFEQLSAAATSALRDPREKQDAENPTAGNVQNSIGCIETRRHFSGR